MSHGSSTKAIMYALGANLGIALAKSGAAFYTGSGSMLAEAIHSYADCANQLLLFLGLHRARIPANRDHPLGYGKAVFFWSFIVALMLFSMGGLFSVYEGVHKLSHAEPVSSAWVALLVLGISIVLEALSLAGALKEINLRRKDRGLWQWLKTSREVELVVVFGEDAAALTGLTFAFFFIFLAYLTGNPVYDALGSIVIGIILIFVAITVGIKIKGLLIGSSADPELEQSIQEFITLDPSIVQVFNIITIQQGPFVMLAAKVKMKESLSIGEAVNSLNMLEKNLKEKFPMIQWTFMEPDVHGDQD